MDLGDKATVAALERQYSSDLLGDILPFWLAHGIDREHGGILTGLDRVGNLIETDKSVWFQGRAAWTFSTAYLESGAKAAWLEAARSCIDFIDRHCFDEDGRMFFRVTREGKPVIKRKRYVFSETFAIVAMAAFARASGERHYAERGLELLRRVLATLATPGILEPKFNPLTRPADGLALHMILIVTAQELRLAYPADPAVRAELDGLIDREIGIIENKFMKPELKAVLEQVGPGGEFQSEHLEGRLLNPGHSIEAAWFIMREGHHRGDPALIGLGERILDWMWEWGWDAQHGGIIYFRDVLGMPASEYWHDMKFWWPQNEAIIATLMAYLRTGARRHAERFALIHDWAFGHFPDREKGEWYGYLHRDGSVSTTLKGNLYKGPFHVPRMMLVCGSLLKELSARLA